MNFLNFLHQPEAGLINQLKTHTFILSKFKKTEKNTHSASNCLSHCPKILLLLLLLPTLTLAEVQAKPEEFTAHFVAAALERTRHQVRYDGNYVVISYPNGDVPDDIGVCTDEVVRVYRKLGIDLQKDLHEDIAGNFEVYPKKWGLEHPDKNIDHRRVLNLQILFARKGQMLAISQVDAGLYQAGDLVTWMLPGNLPHIGMVTDQRSKDGQRPLIVHNIGSGPKLEDMLFNYTVTGHYRYYGVGSASKKTTANS